MKSPNRITGILAGLSLALLPTTGCYKAPAEHKVVRQDNDVLTKGLEKILEIDASETIYSKERNEVYSNKDIEMLIQSEGLAAVYMEKNDGFYVKLDKSKDPRDKFDFALCYFNSECGDIVFAIAQPGPENKGMILLETAKGGKSIVYEFEKDGKTAKKTVLIGNVPLPEGPQEVGISEIQKYMDFVDKVRAKYSQ